MTIRAIILSVALPIGFAHSQFGGDLRVVHHDVRSAVIEYTPTFLAQQEVRTPREQYHFLGAITHEGNPGDVVSRFRAAAIFLPSSRYRVEVVGTEYQERSSSSPPTYPHLKADEAWGVVQVPIERQQDDRFTRISPDQIVELTDISPYGHGSMATLRLYPVQYRSGNVMRLYQKIVIRIEHDPWEGSIERGVDDAIESALSGKSFFDRQRQDSPLAQGQWYRMDIVESGVYKLDQDFFSRSGIALGSLGHIQSIRIFGNGARELPENLLTQRPEGLQEVARHVVDQNDNGQFDAGDYILFYGRSTRGWQYVSPQKTYRHFIHHYADTNSYFLTFGGAIGKQMDSVASTNLTGAYVPEHFQGKHFVEEELFNGILSGRQWVGKSFDENTKSVTFTNLLRGLVTSQPIIYRFIFLSRSSTIDTFRVFENNQQLGTSIFMSPVDVSAIEFEWQYISPTIEFTRVGDLPDNRSVLRMAFGMGNSGARGWIDWFEILYRQRYEAMNDLLLFTSPDTTANVEYRLTGYSSRDVHLFDVSDHSNVKRVTNLVFDQANSSIFRFQALHTTGGIKEFVAVGATGFKSPLRARKVFNSNLQGIVDGADLIIIAPIEFRAAATKLKAHRERAGVDFLKTLIVNVEEIFNEYSGGVLDPMAIRDFLRDAYVNWQRKPRYVLLLGDGTYDYKDNMRRAVKENWIPPYESLNSIHQVLTYASDDHYVILEPNNPRVTVALGRLPVRSANEADAMVTKIIRHELSSPYGSWRNRVTYVADDGLTSRADEGSLHTGQAEVLAQQHTSNSFEKKKIYIVEYPTVASSTGRRKPEANRAIVDAINSGTLVINYTGHGNTKIWAHERIFSDEEDFPKLANDQKLTVLVAATCDYARWDNPLDQSSGEKILVGMTGGAVAVVTSIRVVYSYENSTFNNLLFRSMLTRDSLGLFPRLGDAMKTAKQILYTVNDLKYHLLGDPSMRVSAPHMQASIDSISGKSTAQFVLIPTLGRISFSGGVYETGSSTASNFNGQALIEVFDSKRKVLVPEWGNFSFEQNGSVLYRGEVSVVSGAFQGIFPVPKDVSYDNERARVSAYVWNEKTDGIGFTEKVIIAGTDTTASADTTGPDIRLYLDTEAFRPGDVVQPTATLLVDLFDQSGINTSTAGVGHRLEATLSSSKTPIDLTEYYRGNLDTYQSGQIRYSFSDLTEGRHTVSVKAWDTYNNVSQTETFFEVRVASDETMFNVMNFPNPFSSSTMFTFQRNSFEPIDVEIKIYTLAGRLIERLETFSVTDRFVQVPWHGRDRDGNEVANGVYFYKVITRSFDRRNISEVLGKLAVLR